MSWFKGIVSSFLGESKANVSPEDKILKDMQATQKGNSKRMEEVREERDEKEEREDGLKLVIDGAKLECKLCSSPHGLLKVNFDTPSIQDRRTATVMEKNMHSLVFTGTCTKSPNSSTPCASVMQLGEWKDTGSLKVQDQSPLLLKSTIRCLYGGVSIKITDCGQRNEPVILNTAGAPVPENGGLAAEEKLKTFNDGRTFSSLEIDDN